MSAPDREPAPDAPPRGLQAWLFYVGGCALLLAMSADAVAVIGRHIGIPLLGSIEVVQAAMLVASATALVFATLADKHAVVHLLIDRLSVRGRTVMRRFHSAVCAVFFLSLVVGGVWIALDLRGGYEESELLHIPFGPLRIISILSVLSVFCIYAVRVFKPGRAE
jgi:TRAP-type transport system small permease protein